MSRAHLCLGTASWATDQPYNDRVPPGDDELHRILDAAEAGGIRWLDTAAAYGNVEHRLWNAGDIFDRFDVVTKVRDSLAETGLLGEARAILIHEKTMTVVGEHDRPMLDEITAEGKFAGFSVYTVEQAMAALDLRAHAIQAPWNLRTVNSDSRWFNVRDRAYADGVLFFGRQPFEKGVLASMPMLHPRDPLEWALRTNPRGWCVVGVEKAQHVEELCRWREEMA